MLASETTTATAETARPSSSRKSHESLPTTTSDDDLSVTSSYQDFSDNDLNMYQGAALIAADCLGTGLLALPADMHVLGTVFGLVFLVLNLPINWYAGSILCASAQHVEQQEKENDLLKEQEETTQGGVQLVVGGKTHVLTGDGVVCDYKHDKKNYSSIAPTDTTTKNDETNNKNDEKKEQERFDDDPTELFHNEHDAPHHHYETATFDFIGMTHALFHHPKASRLVMGGYYLNIFLVLGNYILVMSHAVAALIGEDNICLPVAGLVACVLMFGVSQLRTMANLGRAASIISLLALAIVIIQCLVALQNDHGEENKKSSPLVSYKEENTILRQFSAIASIGFAVGSQKLLLNIRHEFRDRTQAPKSLGIAVTLFGITYVTICIVAQPNPPSFLFDAIPPGWNRRLAGFMLWIHVVVSYAINSQAICSSMDRLFFHRVSKWNLCERHALRWMLLTCVFAVSSYLVANAVPFFKDLVALIGASTSIPLTMLLPAVFYRRVLGVPIWWPTRNSLSSWFVLVLAVVYTVLGLVGSLGSIELDWASHGPPFACS